MTGILIVARLGSTRLSHKHLIEAKGKTFIEWLLLRFIKQFENDGFKSDLKIIIATSDEIENRLFETVLKDYPVEIYYGSKQNIPLRQLQCAEVYGLDQIISIDGDDILCSPFGGRKVFEKLLEGNNIVKTKGLPIGLNVWGYKTGVLREALKNFESVSGILETGWGRIFEQQPVFEVEFNEEVNDLRFTLDYPADAAFFSSVINSLGDEVLKMKDEDLIRFVKENKFNELNKDLEEQYLKNFYDQKKSE